jgi:hypothetical protein
MFRNFHNSRGSSTSHARNQSAQWRTVLIALVLALAIGSAGQTPRAQAAPDNPADIYFEVWAFPKNPPPLCINQELKIYVSVNKGIVKIINDKAFDLPRGNVPGVQVRGSMTNAIGTLSSVDDELANLVGGNADFLFTAKKAGKTILTFNADVEGRWTGSVKLTLLGRTIPAKKAEIPVTVRNCKFKVTTIGQWHVPGPASISVVAISDDAEVRSADAQGPFTGSTTVNWTVTSGQVGDCLPQSVTASSQVDWTGNMDDNNLLVLDANYQTAGISLPVFCVGSDGGVAEGSTPVQLTPDPLQVSVLSDGAVFEQPQVLQGPEAMPGYATIIVVPEEDEAVSFIPGDHEAGWGDFSTLLGALLALH